MRQDPLFESLHYQGAFGDLRLEKRAEQLMLAMHQKETAVLNQLAENRADVVGYSRFFHNEMVGEDDLITEAGLRCHALSAGRHVLAIQDTTECNYQAHQGKFDPSDPDVGPVGNNHDLGFFLHPTLVVDATDGFPLGLAHIELWNRVFGHQTKQERHYATRPIEQKESYRWLTSSVATQATLENAECITIVADREADIYEEFVRIPDARTHLLIRSLQNRLLSDQDEKLFEYVATQPAQDHYTFEILSSQQHRQPRQAEMELRFCRVKLCRPKNSPHKHSPAFVELWVVEAKECSTTVPTGEKPVLWRLLTTHPVETVDAARQMIQWYRWRWLIEQVFRLLKQQGLNVEQSQLETGAALRKLVVMALTVTVIILQLTCDREGKAGKPGTVVFTTDELLCMEQIMPRYEGNTVAQQNPYPVRSLAWAAWLIGRLGGWKGYRKACPAGPITMKRGLERFWMLYSGWVFSQVHLK
jgi:hypothetical protein